MCGITAIFAYHADANPVRGDELSAITQQMLARGPDAGGTWLSPDNRVGLGSRRLAMPQKSPRQTALLLRGPCAAEEGDLGLVAAGDQNVAVIADGRC